MGPERIIPSSSHFDCLGNAGVLQVTEVTPMTEGLSQPPVAIGRTSSSSLSSARQKPTMTITWPKDWNVDHTSVPLPHECSSWWVTVAGRERALAQFVLHSSIQGWNSLYLVTGKPIRLVDLWLLRQEVNLNVHTGGDTAVGPCLLIRGRVSGLSHHLGTMKKAKIDLPPWQPCEEVQDFKSVNNLKQDATG